MDRESSVEPFILGETEISGRTAVCCRSESGANEFLRYLDSSGWRWEGGESLASLTYWERCEESIVYFLSPRYKTVTYSPRFDPIAIREKCYIFHDEDDFANKGEQEVLAFLDSMWGGVHGGR